MIRHRFWRVAAHFVSISSTSNLAEAVDGTARIWRDYFRL